MTRTRVSQPNMWWWSIANIQVKLLNWFDYTCGRWVEFLDPDWSQLLMTEDTFLQKFFFPPLKWNSWKSPTQCVFACSIVNYLTVLRACANNQSSFLSESSPFINGSHRKYSLELSSWQTKKIFSSHSQSIAHLSSPLSSIALFQATN